MIGFLTLKGLRPQQIQIELSEVYHGQVFQLPAVEKWHLPFPDKIRDLEDEPRPGRPKKIDLVVAMAELLSEKPFTSRTAIYWRVKILMTICLRVLNEELELRKMY
jgi:hypothetical protein